MTSRAQNTWRWVGCLRWLCESDRAREDALRGSSCLPINACELPVCLPSAPSYCARLPSRTCWRVCAPGLLNAEADSHGGAWNHSGDHMPPGIHFLLPLDVSAHAGGVFKPCVSHAATAVAACVSCAATAVAACCCGAVLICNRNYGHASPAAGPLTHSALLPAGACNAATGAS